MKNDDFFSCSGKVEKGVLREALIEVGQEV